VDDLQEQFESAQQNSMISQELSSSSSDLETGPETSSSELRELERSSSAKKYSRAQKRRKKFYIRINDRL